MKPCRQRQGFFMHVSKYKSTDLTEKPGFEVDAQIRSEALLKAVFRITVFRLPAAVFFSKADFRVFVFEIKGVNPAAADAQIPADLNALKGNFHIGIGPAPEKMFSDNLF